MKTRTPFLKYMTITFAVSIFMFACKKEDQPIVETPEPEIQAPTIQITSPVALATKWNTISIEVSLTDPDNVVKEVDLYANETMIGSKAAAPFTYDWNTKEEEDGEIVLKVVARSDDDKEVASNAVNINVLNTLIHYQLNEDNFSYNPEAKYFTYITNDERQVLYFKQIEELPFEATAIRPDDFEGEKIKVHMVETSPITGSITSYNDVTPGIFSPVNTDEKGAETGTAKITLTDVPKTDYYTVNNLSGESLAENTQTTKQLYANQNLLYVYLRHGDEAHYKIENNLVDGDNVVSLSAVAIGEMELHTFAENQKIVSGIEYHINGHLGTSATSPYARVYRMKTNNDVESIQFDFHTPKDESAFDHYSTFVRVSDGERTFIQNDYYNVLSGISKLNVNFSVGQNKLSEIKVSASGASFDVLKTIFAVYGNDNYLFWWYNYSKDDNISFPPIPTELTALIPGLSNTNLGFNPGGMQLEASEYDHFDNYDNFINRFFGRDGKGIFDDATNFKATFEEFPLNY